MVYSIKESVKNISYDVGGTIDESSFLWPSLAPAERFVSSIMIRNTGDSVVENPRVSINGNKIPLNTEELLGSIVMDSKDALDRVQKIFHTIDSYTVHGGLSLDKWIDSPLTLFIGYGSGMCEDRANVQAMLWDVLSYKWRGSWADNHTVFEVDEGNRILHLDTDTQAYYLMHDNSTIASSQDIRDDPMLVQRSVHYRNYLKYPVSAKDPEPNMWYSSEKVAALYWGINYDIPSSRAPAYEQHSILLKPGEGYGWHSDKPKHLHPLFADSPMTNIVRDLTWEAKLDFSKASHLWAVRQANVSGTPVRNGAVNIDANTTVFLSYDHPFPITGASMKLIPGDNVSSGTLMRVTISGGFDAEKAVIDISLQELLSDNDFLSAYIQNFRFPVHDLQIEISAPNSSTGSTGVPLKGLSFELYCQATTYALRSLKTGRNELVYTDASDKRSIEVLVNATPLQTVTPGFPAGTPFSPADNKSVAEAELIFSWPKSSGADVKGYQIQISGFADMRYPLSPTFERLVEKTDITEAQGVIQYRLPWRGMLPVNCSLYWRVRPYRADLLAGPWSSIFPFKVKGPQSPEKVNIAYDQGRVLLSWSPSPSGTQPLYYEIHSSTLEGFVPISETHRILGLSDQAVEKYTWYDVTATDWPVVPETTLTTTKETRLVLFDGARENPTWFGRLGAHLRVIAVDADGSRSCPSPQAHLQSPLIVMPDSIGMTAGNVAYQVPVISTVGRITVQSPYFLGLWDKPVLTYSLAAPSAGWSIDANLGVIRGYLNASQEVLLNVTVEDQYGAKTSKQFKIKAI
jgi:hypothetical protein